MTPKMKADLEAAGDLIAREEANCICDAMKHLTGNNYEWKKTAEAKMICTKGVFWWGAVTMNVSFDSDEARNARLLGIAMMTTMPPDMVDESL